MRKPLKRKDIKPGLTINHLGTIYTVQRVKYRKCATGRTPEMVTLVNPQTGETVRGGEYYDVNLILKHSKQVEG